MRGILAEGPFDVAREILIAFLVALTAGSIISLTMYTIAHSLEP